MAQSLRAARKQAASSRVHNACLPRPMAAPGSGRFGAALLFMAALLMTPLFAHADIIHVDASAVGANNGSSWADAYTDLQDALAASVTGDEIWVKAGLYKPTGGTDRMATFQLKSGVGIYGGFAGTEDQRVQRDWLTHITVLSGDIDNNDTTDVNGVVVNTGGIVGNNSFNVVTGSGTDATAILDGFVITAGQADASFPNNRGGGMYSFSGSPTLTNLGFSGNRAASGGGIFNGNGSPALINVSFRGNRANQSGGGMYDSDGSATLINVAFSGNRAGTWGGGMYSLFSGPTLIHVSFSGNRADDRGGGMFMDEDSFMGTPLIRNTVFWRNQDGSGTGTAAASLSNAGSNPQISYSLVQGCNPGGDWNTSAGVCGTDGGDNLDDDDPLFRNTPDPGAAPTSVGNLRLRAGSPAIDAGNDAFIADIDNATDLDGNPRKVGDAVDLGPYEYFELPDPLFLDRFEAVLL